MDPELPKKVAAAADIAKTLSQKIEDVVAHLLGLKTNLDTVYPALDVVHQSIKEGDPAYDATDAPAAVLADKGPDDPEGSVPGARLKSGVKPPTE